MDGDEDTRCAGRAVGSDKKLTTAAQQSLRASTATSEDDSSSVTVSGGSGPGFAKGTAPRVTSANGSVVADCSKCPDDFVHRLADWWGSDVAAHYHGWAIEIRVRAGFEKAVQETFEMMTSKPTVEIVDKGKLFLKAQGGRRTEVALCLRDQFVSWAGKGCHTTLETDQKPGRELEVRHDAVLWGQIPPDRERDHPDKKPCLRNGNVIVEVVVAEDDGDVKRALCKSVTMLTRARSVFFANRTKKSHDAFEKTSQSDEIARMLPFVLVVGAFPRDGLQLRETYPKTQQLRERLGATHEKYREIDESTAREKVPRPSTGSIAEARNTAATAAEAAYDAWTQTPGYAAAVAKNAAAKDAIALRETHEFSVQAYERGVIPDLPDNPFPIPAAVLGARPGADLNARLRIDCRPSKYVEEGKDKYDYPQAADAPWFGIFRYDQTFDEGNYYRCEIGETLYVPVPGYVVGRDGVDDNGCGNDADGGYGHHVFPLHYDELLDRVYGL